MSLADAFEVIVETEPEWDDDERSRMRSLASYERSLCDCGFPTSIATDKANYFTFVEKRCPVCAAGDRQGRIQHAADEQATKAAGENAPPGNPLPSDGRKTHMTRMTSDEVAARRAKRTNDAKGGDRGNS